MLFFILSGYWVTRVYCETYAHRDRGVLSFYIARVLRIWPLFALVGLATIAVLSWAGQNPDPEIWRSFLLLGVSSHGLDPVGVSWSLDIELQFYLALPLLVLLAGLTGGARKIAVVGAVLAWIAGLALDRVWGIDTVLHYLPMFAAGMAIYLFRWQVPERMAWLSLALWLLPIVWIIALPELRNYLFHGSGDTFRDMSFAMIWAVYLIPFLAFNVQQKSGWFDAHLGRLSFVLYLVHFPVIKLARALSETGGLSDLERLTCMGVSTALAIVVYLALDTPLERLRKWLSAPVAGSQAVR